MPEQLVPLRVLQVRWNVSRQTLHKWIAGGYLRVVRLSPKVWRVEMREIERFERRELR